MTSQDPNLDFGPQQCAPSPRSQRADGCRPLQGYYTAPVHRPPPVAGQQPCAPLTHQSSTPHLAGPVPRAASVTAETLPTAMAQPHCANPAATPASVPGPAAAGSAQTAALSVRMAGAAMGVPPYGAGCGPCAPGARGGAKRASVDLGPTVFAFPVALHSLSASSPRSAPTSPPVACPLLPDQRDPLRPAASPAPDQLPRTCARLPAAGSPGGRVSAPMAGEGEHQTGRFVIRPLRPAVAAPPAASPGPGPWPASTAACADSCSVRSSSSPEAGPQGAAVREGDDSAQSGRLEVPCSSSSQGALGLVADQLQAQHLQLQALTALLARQAQELARLADTAARQGELTARLLRAQGLAGDEPRDMADALVLLDCENETLRRANDALRTRLALLEARLAQQGGD